MGVSQKYRVITFYKMLKGKNRPGYLKNTYVQKENIDQYIPVISSRPFLLWDQLTGLVWSHDEVIGPSVTSHEHFFTIMWRSEGGVSVVFLFGVMMQQFRQQGVSFVREMLKKYDVLSFLVVFVCFCFLLGFLWQTIADSLG